MEFLLNYGTYSWLISKDCLHFRKLDSNFIRDLPNGMLDNMNNLQTL